MAIRREAASLTDATTSLARLVRDLRERAPLTQEELAERSGLSVGTVRGLESGRILRPRSRSVRGLIDALGLDDDDRAALVAVARGQPRAATTRLRDNGHACDQISASDTVPHAATPPIRSVGRELELDELSRAIADAAAGRGRTILVTGEPGIGKTLLTEDAARSAGCHGARVIVVRCPGNEGAPPYWPWSEALRECFAEGEDSGHGEAATGPWPGDSSAAGRALHRLLPGIASTSGPHPAPGDDSARVELFHRVVAEFHAAARRSPLVLMVDDLHWADTPSLKLFELLANTTPTVPLLLVGTYRDSEGVEDPPVARLASALPGDVTRIELRSLGVEALGRLIARTARIEPAPALVRWVHRHTGGNPLFAEEVVRLLVADGDLDRPPRDFVLPSGVRGVIERRLRRFDATTFDTLRWAAICGDDFDQGLLHQATGMSKDEISTGLGIAQRSRLVRPLPGRPGWHTFTHGLVAETLRDITLPVELARGHLRLGEALARTTDDDRASRVAEVSYHLFAALPEGDVATASDYAVRAARQAAEALAWEEAMRHYDQAIQALQRGVGTESRVADLLVERADVAGWTADGPEARQAALEAVEAARRSGSPSLLARAALVLSARTLADGGDPTTDLIEHALSRLPPDDSPIRAVLLARLAEEAYHLDRRRSRQLTDQALAMAQRTDDPGARWEALVQRHRHVRGAASLEARTSTSRELVDLALRVGEPEHTLLSRIRRITDLMTAGLRQPLDHEIEAFDQTVKQARLRSFSWFVPLWRSSRAVAEGQLAEADAQADEVQRLATVRGEYAMSQVAVLLTGIRAQQCRIHEVEPAIATAAYQHPTMPAYRCALAVIHVELGRPASAQALLEPLATYNFDDLPHDNEWIVGVHCVAETCVALQRSDWARVLYPRLLPYADHHVVSSSGALYLGSAERSLGLLAAQAGELDAAETHYRDALVATQRFGAALWAAQTKLDWAALLVDRGRPDDRESARGLVEEVRAFADERDVPRLRRQLAAGGGRACA